MGFSITRFPEVQWRGHQKEVTHFQGKQTVPDGAVTQNPAFDVTPHCYVSTIITEEGIITPPFNGKIRHGLFASE